MTKRRRWIIGLASCLTVAGAGTWYWLDWYYRHEPLDRAANKVMRDLLAGDGRYVWSYSLEKEHKLYGLTRDSFSKMFTEYVRPRAADLKVVSTKQNWVADGHTLVYEARVARPDGQILFVAVALSTSPNGPRGFVIPAVVGLAMQAKYRREVEGSTDQTLAFLALYDGMDADRAELAQYGITGFIQDPVKWRLVGWNPYRKAYYGYFQERGLFKKPTDALSGQAAQ